MRVFRHRRLRLYTSIFIVFAGLFLQIQTLYACHLTGGPAKHVCCCGKHKQHNCPMAAHCDMAQPEKPMQCCEISYDLANENGLAENAGSSADLVLMLDASQPPPLLDDILSGQIRLSLVAALPLYPPDYAHTPSPVFLISQRFRL